MSLVRWDCRGYKRLLTAFAHAVPRTGQGRGQEWAGARPAHLQTRHSRIHTRNTPQSPCGLCRQKHILRDCVRKIIFQVLGQLILSAGSL